eukprot:CAMPEP_0181057772 /NCGR_PEP_ID=MMETSP1070-20121207/20433_1 /TAXON_ID=265543 /ORGANISM="Minutocellus polymorphus, Strain NH13" /LENGTH=293 /DNA_ID=CAMNT_0023137217 /DNA_START=81 /DNA_END=962 /DNA_ORIENTATION=+
MTTAHRPTWKAAVGRAQEGGWGAGGAVSTQRSALDAPAHTKLKTRQGGQVVDRRAALAESLRKLEEAERKSGADAIRRGIVGRREIDPEEEKQSRLKLLEHDQSRDVDEEALLAKYDDADDDKSDDGAGGWSDIDDDAGGGGTKVAANRAGGGGSDLDESDSDLDSSDDDSDDDDSDDSDDEAALQAELAKIRAEREAARAKEEEEARVEEEARMEEAALTGNPLLSAAGGGGADGGAAAAAAAPGGRMKRRWNDDVVFRNQAKGEPDQNKKRFINDTVRNDFHKRFLNKFIK